MIELLDSLLTQTADLLGRLYSVPGYVMVFLSCLGFGYGLKKFRRFPNEAIPLAVIMWGTIWTMAIADPRADNFPLRVWMVKNLVFGSLIGAAAWALHANRRRIPLLKKLFPESDDTKFKRNPEAPAKPVEP